jgi:hypothetical protein
MSDTIGPQRETKGERPGKAHVNRLDRFGALFKRWWCNPMRVPLLRWSAGFFTMGTVITLIVALRYFIVYPFPTQPLGIVYTIAAFVSHFASFLLILWVAPVALVLLFFPFRKLIIPLGIGIVSIVVTLVLLDSQVFTSHRFHFTFLTIRIFGFKTWGFGILYLLISLTFMSFIAKSVWDRNVVQKKKLYPVISLSLTLGLLLFTHLTHIWADATGYVPVTRFTTTLPLFYPSTDKKQMMKMGIIDISDRRTVPSVQQNVSGFYYPKTPLSFTPPATPCNILLIAVDGMRNDVMTAAYAPECMKLVQTSGLHFTNHWSGGNSSKMGCFSLFYGIPPTYEKYVESVKHSPLFIDRLLEMNYGIGIFTSYRLHVPSSLDITAFVNVPHLRLETKIQGPTTPYRTDSAITGEWKAWLDTTGTQKPFFGFLFYDALLRKSFPASFGDRVSYDKNASDPQKEFAKYKVSVMYIDSLIGTVITDLEKRQLRDKTIIIITADHGLEFDDNNLGFNGHGSAFSDYQVRVPLVVVWPGKAPGISDKRTCHYDIVPTLMKDALGCTNKESDYSSGFNLFSDRQHNWHIVGSYFNFAIIEPEQVTIQFPGGYYESRDHRYQLLPKAVISPYLSEAFLEMGRFHRK